MQRRFVMTAAAVLTGAAMVVAAAGFTKPTQQIQASAIIALERASLDRWGRSEERRVGKECRL